MKDPKIADPGWELRETHARLNTATAALRATFDTPAARAARNLQRALDTPLLRTARDLALLSRRLAPASGISDLLAPDVSSLTLRVERLHTEALQRNTEAQQQLAEVLRG